MINKAQQEIALKQGWTIEHTPDGLVLNFDGSYGRNIVEQRNFFRKANYWGITKLWVEDDETNLLDTIARYRRQYGYGERFINSVLDEDDCVIDLRDDGVGYREMVLGLEEYDRILEELFNGLDSLTR